MADLAVSTAGKIRIVESIIQFTLPAAEAITAGDIVRLDTTNGKVTKANGSSAGEARVLGIATKSVAAGLPVTCIRKGVLDGFDLSALAFDAAVYASDTDGRVADAAGTVSVVVGRVVSATANLLGASLDKLLFIDL